MNHSDAFQWRPVAREVDGGDRKRHADRLRDCGIAPTPQRVDIAAVLFGKGGHFTAEQVLATLNDWHSGVSRATVYNTLNLFAERGLLKPLVLGRDCVIYDTNISAHHHMVDVTDTTLVDIPSEAIRVTGLPELPEGTSLDGVEIVVRVHQNAVR